MPRTHYVLSISRRDAEDRLEYLHMACGWVVPIVPDNEWDRLSSMEEDKALEVLGVAHVDQGHDGSLQPMSASALIAWPPQTGQAPFFSFWLDRLYGELACPMCLRHAVRICAVVSDRLHLLCHRDSDNKPRSTDDLPETECGRKGTAHVAVGLPGFMGCDVLPRCPACMGVAIRRVRELTVMDWRPMCLLPEDV